MNKQKLTTGNSQELISITQHNIHLIGVCFVLSSFCTLFAILA
jgi:hypothetical protein